MGKFYGEVGYAVTVETSPGVWTPQIIEHVYTGDILKNTKRFEQRESLNDDITINNIISIIADPFAYENLYMLRYVKWMGACWKVSSIEIQPPRILLTLGGAYNGL